MYFSSLFLREFLDVLNVSSRRRPVGPAPDRSVAPSPRCPPPRPTPLADQQLVSIRWSRRRCSKPRVEWMHTSQSECEYSHAPPGSRAASELDVLPTSQAADASPELANRRCQGLERGLGRTVHTDYYSPGHGLERWAL